MSTSPTVSKHKRTQWRTVLLKNDKADNKRTQWRKGFLKKDKADKADKADEADKGKDKGQEKAEKADDCHTSSSSSNEPWRAAEKGTKRYEGVTLDGREEALEFPYCLD